MVRAARHWECQFLCTAILYLVLASPASAQWSATGNTAIVDEASIGDVVMYDTGSVALAPRFVGTAQVRRPINHVGGFLDPERDLCLWVRVRDLGATDRVVIRVRELTDFNGIVSTLATWDSDTATDFAGTPFETDGDTRYRMGVLCPIRRGGQELKTFEWDVRTYYVEATLTRTIASGNPGIMAVRVDSMK
jgi:hypothetical protein